MEYTLPPSIVSKWRGLRELVELCHWDPLVEVPVLVLDPKAVAGSVPVQELDDELRALLLRFDAGLLRDGCVRVGPSPVTHCMD